MALAAALTSTLALAGNADRISQKTSQMTALGQRLMPLNANTATRDPAYWEAVADIIKKSNASADARADAGAGHAGLMTHADDAVAGRALAPGVKCFDRSEPGRRAVFLFAYNAERSPALGPALLAFDAYATAYNREVLKRAALGDTNCQAIGE